mgnify:FL=1
MQRVDVRLRRQLSELRQRTVVAGLGFEQAVVPSGPGRTQSGLNLGRAQWNPCCQVDAVNGKHAPDGPSGRSERSYGD